MTKIAVVTTFNAQGYEQYAQRLIQTFIKNWPSDVVLYAYAEDCTVTETSSNLVIKNLHESSNKLVEFKRKWKNVPKANGDISTIPHLSSRKDSHKPFKWDAVRFAHKVYSIFHCAIETDADILLWMDADIVCHSPVTKETLEKLCCADLCFLGREGKYTECGLYAMDLRSTVIREFLTEFQRMYDDAENGIFTLEEWHDSFVFDAVREKFPFLQSKNWSQGVIRGEGHPLINCEWGAYLDHLKGDRKIIGRSKNKDLKVKRTESYWTE